MFNRNSYKHHTPSPEEEALAPHPKSFIGKLLRLIPILILVAGGIFLWFFLGLDEFFSLASLRENRFTVTEWVAENRESAIVIFMCLYILAVAFSLPVGTFMTIVSGFLFGALVGGTASLLAATVGSFIVFIAARTAFRDLFRSKAKHVVNRIRHHFENQAFSYLLFLRLVPIFPFWLINIVPAFTNVSPWAFFFATLLGALPATFIFASFGSGLGQILDKGMEPDLNILAEPGIFLPLLGLGVLVLIPVIYRNRRRLKAFFSRRPKT